MLLPLAAGPFTAPTDHDGLPSERRESVDTHRTCVFGYRRDDHLAAADVSLREAGLAEIDKVMASALWPDITEAGAR